MVKQDTLSYKCRYSKAKKLQHFSIKVSSSNLAAGKYSKILID